MPLLEKKKKQICHGGLSDLEGRSHKPSRIPLKLSTKQQKPAVRWQFSVSFNFLFSFKTFFYLEIIFVPALFMYIFEPKYTLAVFM